MGYSESSSKKEFIVLNSYINNVINNLCMYFKVVEIKKEVNPQISRKEIIKTRAEINEMETKSTIQTIDETKSWFIERINKIDKLTKRKREKTQINKIRDGKDNTTTNAIECYRNIGDILKTYTLTNWKVWKKQINFKPNVTHKN
jgi:GTP-binding protein EngB required for normal cell division